MQSRYTFFGLTLSLLLLFVQGSVAEQKTDLSGQVLPKINIGIITDGPLVSRPKMVEFFQREILTLTRDEFIVSFPQEMVLESDSTVEKINQQFDQLLNNPETDLIITLGTIGSTQALKRKQLVKPVVAPFILDAELQHAPESISGSGVENLYYVNLGIPFKEELVSFQKLVPFKKVALLLDERDLRGAPEIRELNQRLAQEFAIDIQLISVGQSAEEAVAQIPDDIKAVMAGPLWQLSSDETKVLAKYLLNKKIASFAMANFDYVTDGFLATTMPEGALEQLARQVAINVQEILLGEKPESLPVVFSKGQKLTINMATARAIDVYPSLDYMTGAHLLNEQRDDIERKLTLLQVIEEALTANLDLASAEREVLAGRYSVGEAKSALLSQILVGTRVVVIDEDRATLSQGTNPEKSWSGSLGVAQQIYSEGSWAGYSVQKSLQQGREFNRDTVKLDIMYEASISYLNVLRRKTVEQLQKDNMQLTQANLERAQTRLSTGVADPSELYRWQSKFANDRQVVLRVESATMDSMQELNRILNRPILEEFIAVETDLSDPLLIGGNRLFYQLINNPLYMRRFNNFAVEVGLDASPELKVLGSAIRAQERLIVKAGREYWAPTISLEGNVDYLFSDGGNGQRNEDLTGQDEADWQIGVFATLPLFEGGRRGATLGRTREELQQLHIQRKSASEKISQRIHRTLNNTRASYPAINLSKDAVEAARLNLELVSNSYEQGIKSIIELLDAQNQALNAELDAANAVYNFLIDFMGVQRSMGVFVTLLPASERNQWKLKAKEYLMKSK